MALNFAAKKAVRDNVYVKIMLTGVSGSGKSYSALRLATGMADEIEKIRGTRPDIVMFNSEGSRGNYYAGEFEYDIWPAPGMTVTQEELTPETYCDWIDFQIQEHTKNDIPPILVLDGVTPEWKTMLAAHSKAGGQFKDWARIDPRHNAFKDKIVLSKAHIIATARAKSQYVIENDGRKSTVRKVGLGAEMREGFDYECTLSFAIDQKTHTAAADKDNTHLFDSRQADRILTEADGQKIAQWAYSDKAQQANVASLQAKKAENVTEEVQETPVNTPTLPELKQDIKVLIAQYLDNTPDEEQKKQMRGVISSTIKQYVKNDRGVPVADYRVIKEVELAQTVYNALTALSQ